MDGARVYGSVGVNGLPGEHRHVYSSINRVAVGLDVGKRSSINDRVEVNATDSANLYDSNR